MSDLLARSRAVMPGGVSSPVRAFRAVPGEPPIVARASGARITDAHDRSYLDLVCSWGPLILGHAHPAVLEAVTTAARDGLTFGATCAREVELAERVLRCFRFGERVRFVSSGTEAVMSAVRLARGATGRDRIVKFEGCYHGHSDGLLVEAGSGLATFGIPSSAGVPAAIADLTDVLPLDDEVAVERLFAQRGDQIAAVVIEPLPANCGLLVQRQEFLQKLRDLTQEYGALLIFDEVISGFRVAPGGMTELTGIVPDLVTLGKVIGGGMPVGAYVGAAELMELVAPTGPVYQAGTLSGNPVAMAAGIATLDLVLEHGFHERLEEISARLAAGWSQSLARRGLGSVVRVGSILWVSLQDGEPPRTQLRISESAAARYGRLHAAMLKRGVWMAPSGFEVAFVSTAHSIADIDEIVESFDASLDCEEVGTT